MNDRPDIWKQYPELSLALLREGYTGFLKWKGLTLPKSEKYFSNKKSSPLLLIGWDSADWDFLNPLIDQGKLPFLQSIIDNSAKGKLASIKPMLSPMLWTSIATGKYPYRHGVVGFTERNDKGETLPISSLSRRVKAFWNLLTEQNISQNIVGWWPSHPVEKISGTMLSQMFVQGAEGHEEHVYPAEFQEIAEKLRVEAHEIPLELILMLMDTEAGKPEGKLMKACAQILAQLFTTHNIFSYLLTHQPGELNAVYFNAPDAIAHLAMPYASQKNHPAHSLLANIYKLLDGFLEVYAEILKQDFRLMLLSDHGYKPIEKGNTLQPEQDHELFGMLLMHGQGIKTEPIFGASILDVCPTLLQWLGLPHAQDADGNPLAQIFDFPLKKPVNTYEQLSDDLPFVVKKNSASDAYTQHLEDLGYLAKGSSAEHLDDENQYYLALSYAHAGHWKEALNALKIIIPETEEDFPVRYLTWALQAAWAANEPDYATEIWEKHFHRIDAQSEQAYLLKALKAQVEKQYDSALKFYEELHLLNPQNPDYLYKWAQCLFDLGQWNLGLQKVEEAMSLQNTAQQYHTLKGDFLWMLQQDEEALESYFEAVALQYFLPAVHYKIGLLLWKLQHKEAAVQAWQVCRMQAPRFLPVRELLLKIYKNQEDSEFYKLLSQETKALRKGEIIVVTGLPRSGTSLMMQILEASGIVIFQDGHRVADDFNAQGYYEHEQVKELARRDVLAAAVGKAVKVLNPLLKHLPQHYQYKIIYMNRSTEAIAASRLRILQAKAYPIQIQHIIEKEKSHLEQTLAAHPEWQVLPISYEELFSHPEEISLKIQEFLGIDKLPDVQKLLK